MPQRTLLFAQRGPVKMTLGMDAGRIRNRAPAFRIGDQRSDSRRESFRRIRYPDAMPVNQAKPRASRSGGDHRDP